MVKLCRNKIKMKNLKLLILMLGFFSVEGFAQDISIEDMPKATLTSNFFLTLDPTTPVSEYYYVDLSNMEFANEAEAIKLCRTYLTANLVSNVVHFSENYMIIRIHIEHMGGDLDYTKIQTYLNQLSKPQ